MEPLFVLQLSGILVSFLLFGFDIWLLYTIQDFLYPPGPDPDVDPSKKSLMSEIWKNKAPNIEKTLHKNKFTFSWTDSSDIKNLKTNTRSRKK